jgi:hypothetical protein
MVRLELHDGKNYVFLTEGYLPDMEAIRKAYPRSPWFFRQTVPSFTSREEAVAWTLSAYARRLTTYIRFIYGPVENALRIRLGTWVVGPSNQPDARLANWFTGGGEKTDYRLVIHRNALVLGDRQVPAMWARLHDYLEGKQKRIFPFRHRRFGKGSIQPLKAATTPFLEELLRAYRNGESSAEDIMIGSRHPYWFSRGLPGGKR